MGYVQARHIGSLVSHLASLLRSSCGRGQGHATGFGGSRSKYGEIVAQFQLMIPQGYSTMKNPLTEPHSSKTSVKAVRMQREREYEGKPKDYRHTYSVVHVDDGGTLFRCDVVGHVTSHQLIFCTHSNEHVFSMRPNRKIMPTAWPVTDAKGQPVGRITQKILGKGVWAATDSADREVFRIVDAEQAVDRVGRAVFGGVSSAYWLVQGDLLIATTSMEPREAVTKRGIRAFLKAFVTPSDWVVRFVPEAPEVDLRLVTAAMILLIDFTQIG